MRDERGEKGSGAELIEGCRRDVSHMARVYLPSEDLQFWHTIRMRVAKVARIHRAKFFHCLRSVSEGVNHGGMRSAFARASMREGGGGGGAGIAGGGGMYTECR